MPDTKEFFTCCSRPSVFPSWVAQLKSLKGSFGAGQLVFYRNPVGLVFLIRGLYKATCSKRRKTSFTPFSRDDGNNGPLYFVVLYPAYTTGNGHDAIILLLLCSLLFFPFSFSGNIMAEKYYLLYSLVSGHVADL